MKNYQIRPLTPPEYSLLQDFLYEAIFQTDETNLAPKTIIEKPELQVYIRDFGTKKTTSVFVPRQMNRYGDDEGNAGISEKGRLFQSFTGGTESKLCTENVFERRF